MKRRDECVIFFALGLLIMFWIATFIPNEKTSSFKQGYEQGYKGGNNAAWVYIISEIKLTECGNLVTLKDYKNNSVSFVKDYDCFKLQNISLFGNSSILGISYPLTINITGGKKW